MQMRMVAVAVCTLAVVGCSERLTRLPEQPETPTFDVQGGNTFSTSCSFTTANQLAGSYFTNNDTTRVVRGLIGDMKSAGEGTVTARNAGFDVLVHVSKNVAANTDEQTGSALVNELIKCMFSDPNAWPAAYTAAVPGPEDFTVALDATLNGAFEVRGGANDSDSAARARLDSYSGIAPPSGSSWADVLDTNANPDPKRVLLYGRPSVEQPGINPKTFYNWRVVARNTVFDPAVIVGVCIDAFTNSFGNGKAMIHRQDQAGSSYLPFADAYFLIPGNNPGECTVHSASLSSSWEHLAQGLFRIGSELLGPRPLSATSVMNPGGLGGSTGGIHTDYGPESVDTVYLAIVTQPHDARVCTAPSGSGCSGNQTISPVKVTAIWHGSPVGGVRITAIAVDNNGTPAQLRGTSTLTTGEDGVVTFTDLGLTKPGAYRLLTNAELVVSRSSEIVIQHVTSTKFNIRP
jgi:hypothetical protein